MGQIEMENLIGTRKRLLDEINLLSFDELNKKPDEDSWSIAQVCHHLSLVEASSAKAIRYGLKQTETHKVEKKPIDRLSDRTKKFKAPDIVKPSEEPLTVEQIINLLKESRTFLFTTLDKIEDTTILSERSVKHPRFGELPLNQWVEVVYHHEQRHIEQIKEIKKLR